MPNRREQIELLIGSQYDQLWFPAGSLKTQPGLAPGEKIPCRDCGGVELRDDFGKLLKRRKGAGTVLDAFKRRVPCGTCGGRVDAAGVISPGSGWIERDRMDRTKAVIGSEQTQASSRPRKTVACDACAGEGATAKGRCERCDGSGRRDLHVFDLQLDTGGERAERWKGIDPESLGEVVDGAFILRRDALGSYHELDLAQAALARASYSARKLVDQVYTFQIVALNSLGLLGREKLEFGMRYLLLKMPDEIKVPRQVIQNQRIRANHRTTAKGKGQQTASRDLEMRELARQGWTPQKLGEVYGLSRASVYAIVNHERSAA